MKENVIRCGWVEKGNTLYEHYHDSEWGVPVYDDIKFFEFLILEGAQAGLSWITILKRREGYREAFSGFDPSKVASYGKEDCARLLREANIIRHPLKIESAVKNAGHFLEIQKEFGSFSNYVWRFVGGAPKRINRRSLSEIPSQTEESKLLSKDLKKRGFNFVGPTIMYAFMQATGLVNDHTMDCFCYKKEH